MKRSEIYETVKAVMIDTLGFEEDTEMRLDSKLMDDLGAESIDFLDIMSRLERRYDVTLDKGEKVEAELSEILSEEDLEIGILPAEALAELPRLMPEIDPAEFVEGLQIQELSTLLTINSMIILVTMALSGKGIEVEDDM
jgi:acyl carrier protein